MDKISKITDFYQSHHRMPTYAEITKLLSYKSKSAAYYFVQKLVEGGIISKDRSGKLIPRSLGDIKILGFVQAGFPTIASEDLLDTLSLDNFLVDKKEATYLLKVSGDSMKDAGILEGDLVLVERGREVREGDIVVAEVDGDFTLKYYRVKNKKVYLESANKKYKPIYPKEELSIHAVVVSVIRKYK